MRAELAVHSRRVAAGTFSTHVISVFLAIKVPRFIRMPVTRPAHEESVDEIFANQIAMINIMPRLKIGLFLCCVIARGPLSSSNDHLVLAAICRQIELCGLIRRNNYICLEGPEDSLVQKEPREKIFILLQPALLLDHRWGAEAMDHSPGISSRWAVDT